ncbi:hypothetical protein [Microbulbifer sp. TYP-18]|uniref:hypothetical protein n=1 Tax=Microbulbifer sp. TYP-18 TaxID=3230024 RepID=UPI0034C69577
MKAGTVKYSLLAIALAAVGIPIVTWWLSVGNPLDYLSGQFPPGQSLYILSKLAGLLAIGLLGLQCLMALVKRLYTSRWSQVWEGNRWSKWFHPLLGGLIFVLILLHVSLFFSAVTLRAGAPAWGLLLPRFDQGFYNRQVSLGLIAFVLLCLNVFAGWKLASGKGKWRIGHFLWILILPLSFIHALSIGSESRIPLMFGFLLLMSGLLSIAGLVRIRRSIARGIQTSVPRQAPSFGGNH